MSDLSDQMDKLEAENAKLREYVQHKPACMKSDAVWCTANRKCTCGLEDVLKDAADPSSKLT